MPTQATLRTVQSVLSDDGAEIMPDEREYRWTVAAGVLSRQEISLTGSSSVTLSVPSGAKKVRIILPATAVSITIKGNSADTGIPLSPSSNFIGGTCEFTLGSSPVIILANGNSTARVASVFWL